MAAHLDDVLMKLAEVSDQLTAQGRRRLRADEAGELAGLVVTAFLALRVDDLRERVDVEERRLGQVEAQLGTVEREVAEAADALASVEAARRPRPEAAGGEVLSPEIRVEVIELIQKLNRLL